ncbi:hypothetical protein MIMGU_mgv1a022268mg [Erythranthe guttata]|uniref:Cyclin N-terminal domain-containing protein n=1 Tax=Erythranthe guttata TaxID=4155 RepID=A0A022Q0L6_ERYGU|nr:PREDICTED: cyclin-A1-4-like [Erythranthe guttata]EYU22092.1 hypothetical protein MIMGU_mgv1a022268mg [Erythranthe guttata]|eukprot:XP_012855828.1 PREDICTED: cyclin-A1-4-like [Erythranthe guttata]
MTNEKTTDQNQRNQSPVWSNGVLVNYLFVSDEKYEAIMSSIAAMNSLSLESAKTLFETTEDIHKDHRNNETRRRPRPDYMHGHFPAAINPLHRAHCVEHLVNMSVWLGHRQETLHLAVNCLDRYLSSVAGSYDLRAPIVIVAVACMAIACKYVENRVSEFGLKEFVRISMNMFTCDDIVRTERVVLRQLNYELAGPTAWSFLERYLTVAELGETRGSLGDMASYVVELSLVSYEMLRYLPSMVAASTVFLTRWILFPGDAPWDAKMEDYTRYQPSDLKECVLELHALYEVSTNGKPDLVAVKKKYDGGKYNGVSSWISPPSIPLNFFSNSYTDHVTT